MIPTLTNLWRAIYSVFLTLSLSMYVCVCVSVHVCMCTQWLYIPVHVCGEIYMGIWTHAYRYQRSNLGIPTQFSLPCFVRQVVSIGWGLASKADWPSSQSPGICWSHPLNTGIISVVMPVCFFYFFFSLWILRIELRCARSWCMLTRLFPSTAICSFVYTISIPSIWLWEE